MAEADTLEQLLRLAPAERTLQQTVNKKTMTKAARKFDPRQQWLFE